MILIIKIINLIVNVHFGTNVRLMGHIGLFFGNQMFQNFLLRFSFLIPYYSLNMTKAAEHSLIPRG